MSRLPLVLGLTAMVGLAAAGVRAEDEPPLEQESAYGAIQKRLYEVDHELSLGWAYLPLNPYYKGYGASLSYTIH
jgi:hypothetical protein